jgi:hypothetical protein
MMFSIELILYRTSWSSGSYSEVLDSNLGSRRAVLIGVSWLSSVEENAGIGHTN